jgi:hypothetical protein
MALEAAYPDMPAIRLPSCTLEYHLALPCRALPLPERYVNRWWQD